MIKPAAILLLALANAFATCLSGHDESQYGAISATPLGGLCCRDRNLQSGVGVEIWKENELCGTVDHDRLRNFARQRRPENLVAIVESMLEHPSMKPATKKELVDFTSDWFRAVHI